MQNKSVCKLLTKERKKSLPDRCFFILTIITGLEVLNGVDAGKNFLEKLLVTNLITLVFTATDILDGMEYSIS